MACLAQNKQTYPKQGKAGQKNTTLIQKQRQEVPMPGKNEPDHPLKWTSGEALVVMDWHTGKVLWSRRPDEPKFPASTTKIMTAILMLERTQPDERITAPKDVNKVGEASLHLAPDEVLTSMNLLKGILLRSANDGCYMAAVHIGGSVPKFSELMNQKAKQLGCKNTNFTNPNGLHEPDHKTTAYDLALMGRYAMQNPVFRKIVGHRRGIIQRSISTDTVLRSKNVYLDLDKTADGVKTGFTVPAGNTYVGSATRGGRRIITALLHAPLWAEDNAKMFDWAFANSRVELIHEKGAITQEELGTSRSIKVPLYIKYTAYACFTAGKSELSKKFEWLPNLVHPLKRNMRVGVWTLTDEDGFVQSFDVFAARDEQKAEEPTQVEQAWHRIQDSPTGFVAITGGVAGAGVLAVLAFIKTRNQRRQLAESKKLDGETKGN
jgi:D-alanyl-D-alanine carboxypeptidase (penicillin-binding protein 5/6)